MRLVIELAPTKTGKIIGDFTWDFCKKVSDAVDVSTVGATLTELGNGQYILDNPNVTKDTVFRVHLTAEATAYASGLFTASDGNTALETTSQSILTETSSHPTLAEMEVSLATKTDLSALQNVTEYDAASYLITGGTLDAGGLADTFTLNQTYLDVREQNTTLGIEVEFTFNTNADEVPAKLNFYGRYQGGGTHYIYAQAWNYLTSSWENLANENGNIESTSADSILGFILRRGQHDAVTGQVKVRFKHSTATFNTNHILHIDKVEVLKTKVVEVLRLEDIERSTVLAQTIDTQLSNTHGAGLWANVQGSLLVSIQLYLTATTTPILDVDVTVLNSDESVLLGIYRSSSMGIVAPALNAGTYKLRLYKAGYTFTNPATIVVDDTHVAFTQYGNAFVVPVPSAPSLQVLYGTVKDLGIGWAAGDIFEVYPTSAQAVGSYMLTTEKKTATLDASGAFSLEVDKGASVTVRLKKADGSVYFSKAIVVTADDSKNLATY